MHQHINLQFAAMKYDGVLDSGSFYYFVVFFVGSLVFFVVLLAVESQVAWSTLVAREEEE